MNHTNQDNVRANGIRPNGIRPNGILFLFWIILVFCLSSCGSSEYWVPPHSAGSAFALGTEPDDNPSSEFAEDPSAESAPTADPEIKTEPANQNGRSESLPVFSPPSDSLPKTPEAPDFIVYKVQAADTLPAIAVRFDVQPGEITSDEPIPETAFLRPGQVLTIPRKTFPSTTSSTQLLPDSEFINSPSAVDFDVNSFIESTQGKLSSYSEWHKSTGLTSGADIVSRVAIENSVNPRLLLSLLEFESGWVYGFPPTEDLETYPMGNFDQSERGLYNQLVWAVNQLSIGYYAWREGRLTSISFPDGSSARLAPDLNAGTAALMVYFSRKYQGDAWLQALNPETGLPAVHKNMFGDSWARARTVEPLYPIGIRQPPLTLPFQRGWIWAFTGGPHGAWERDGSYAALDFAPSSTAPGCIRSPAWTLAASNGLVTRSGNGLVVLDLDGDGYEQTGWVLVYLHVSAEDRIPVGSWVSTGDRLGHPSCEGGISTGTHVHLARKFNGEWVPAAGPLPFNLGGWIAQPSEEAYQGTLVRDGQTVKACTCASQATFMERGPDDP